MLKKFKYGKTFYSTSTPNRTPLQRFWKGFMMGWNMPTLPDNVLAFHNHPLVRILRVIGGLSIIIWLWTKDTHSYAILFLPFAMLQFLYMSIISIIKLKHKIYLWRSGKLEVRNSPLDRLATLAIRLAACLKGACDIAVPTGGILGLGLGIDEVLKHSGRNAIFKPTLGEYLDKALTSIGIENPNDKIYQDVLRYVRRLNINLLKLKDEIEGLNELKQWSLSLNEPEINELIDEAISPELSEQVKDIKSQQSKVLE